MADNKVAPAQVSENRQEWFWMLVSYMKMKTFAVWIAYYPETSFEAFEIIWPILFDQMLAQATAASMKALQEKTPVNVN